MLNIATIHQERCFVMRLTICVSHFFQTQPFGFSPARDVFYNRCLTVYDDRRIITKFSSAVAINPKDQTFSDLLYTWRVQSAKAGCDSNVRLVIAVLKATDIFLIVIFIKFRSKIRKFPFMLCLRSEARSENILFQLTTKSALLRQAINNVYGHSPAGKFQGTIFSNPLIVWSCPQFGSALVFVRHLIALVVYDAINVVAPNRGRSKG